MNWPPAMRAGGCQRRSDVHEGTGVDPPVVVFGRGPGGRSDLHLDIDEVLPVYGAQIRLKRKLSDERYGDYLRGCIQIRPRDLHH